MEHSLASKTVQRLPSHTKTSPLHSVYPFIEAPHTCTLEQMISNNQVSPSVHNLSHQNMRRREKGRRLQRSCFCRLLLLKTTPPSADTTSTFTLTYFGLLQKLLIDVRLFLVILGASKREAVELASVSCWQVCAIFRPGHIF